eukprot:1201782-Pleurochrysis_carterae.AAC.1
MGFSYNSYPCDEGWFVKNNPNPKRLSSLTVHRQTQIFTPESKPPNAEKAWDLRLTHTNVSINWPAVWSSVGTFLTTPADEKTWFKLVHRALRVNGKEDDNKSCRLCGYHTESQLHLLQCPTLLPVREYVIELFAAMGVSNDTQYNELTWLLGMSADGTLLPPAHVGVVRIFWRHAYAAMTRLKLDGDPFLASNVKREIARTMYMRILAYQQSRLLFFYRRRFSSFVGQLRPV